MYKLEVTALPGKVLNIADLPRYLVSSIKDRKLGNPKVYESKFEYRKKYLNGLEDRQFTKVTRQYVNNELYAMYIALCYEEEFTLVNCLMCQNRPVTPEDMKKEFAYLQEQLKEDSILALTYNHILLHALLID